MAPTWFEALMGFQELPYEETRRNLEVVGTTLRSRINNRSYVIGELETPSLKELRNEAATLVGGLAGTLKVSSLVGDVRRMHRDPANRHAMFQVASQFNLLEMAGPHVTPEDGVTRYIQDHTQGPACAIAAGAATIYRNYCVPVGGHAGQTRDRQVDCLKDIGAALGNDTDRLWTMTNGYALCTEKGLATIDRRLEALDAHDMDELRDLLRIGIHSGVQVTDVEHAELVVSQAFCSALPVAYSKVTAERWKSFAVLVLEGAYEATLWAAVINAHRYSSKVVFLTLLGGGAFGNAPPWIHDAMRRALNNTDDARAYRTFQKGVSVSAVVGASAATWCVAVASPHQDGRPRAVLIVQIRARVVMQPSRALVRVAGRSKASGNQWLAPPHFQPASSVKDGGGN